MSDAIWSDVDRARFWSKAVAGPHGCIVWTAARCRDGYGKFGGGRKPTVKAHRFAYEDRRGPIPPGLCIDHLCRNRACVNPTHMEVVSNQTNVLRGVGITAQNARKTHCKHGHEFTPENTGRDRNGPALPDLQAREEQGVHEEVRRAEARGEEARKCGLTCRRPRRVGITAPEAASTRTSGW